MHWRLHNGNAINVWSQPWLNLNHNSHISSPPPIARLVILLIMKQEIGKIKEILNDLFNAKTVCKIQKILLLNVQEDKLIWKFSHNGMYTVRSAFFNIMELILDNEHLKVAGKWNSIWSIHAPPKIKHFVWRLLRGCLPTRQRLVHKRVECP